MPVSRRNYEAEDLRLSMHSLRGFDCKALAGIPSSCQSTEVIVDSSQWGYFVSCRQGLARVCSHHPEIAGIHIPAHRLQLGRHGRVQWTESMTGLLLHAEELTFTDTWAVRLLFHDSASINEVGTLLIFKQAPVCGDVGHIVQQTP